MNLSRNGIISKLHKLMHYQKPHNLWAKKSKTRNLMHIHQGSISWSLKFANSMDHQLSTSLMTSFENDPWKSSINHIPSTILCSFCNIFRYIFSSPSVAGSLTATDRRHKAKQFSFPREKENKMKEENFNFPRVADVCFENKSELNNFFYVINALALPSGSP